jgi:hypothetical protein
MKKTTKVQSKNPIRVGNAVLIRAVTLYYTGRIVEITKDEIVLSDAAWIADTGRFENALRTGIVNECEPFVDPVAVGRGAIVDVTHWKRALPRAVK